MTFDLASLGSITQLTTNNRENTGRTLDDFFYDLERRVPYFSSPNREPRFYPQLDVSETNSNYHISLDLPVVNKKDIDVKIDNNILTIKGKKEFDKEHKDNNFYTRERHRQVNK
jgi:HSP20 family protein